MAAAEIAEETSSVELLEAQVLARVETSMFGTIGPMPLGRYQLLEELGAGGMGTVHAAWDPVLQRRVAIKILRHGIQREIARMRREARAMAAVVHPHVVGLLDVGDALGQPFLVMELVEGPNLAHWLSQGARPWQEVMQVLLQCAEGVAAVHHAGLVHRDLKPANVLIDPRLGARVTDFGLTRFSSLAAAVTRVGAREGMETITQAGVQPGTPAYMAPEQRSGEPADARSDQWSLCLTAYEALFGAAPPGSIIAHRVPWQAARGRVPAAVERVLRRGLDPQPEQRWPSVVALVGALDTARRRPRTTAGRVLTLAFAAGFGLGCGHPRPVDPAAPIELCTGRGTQTPRVASPTVVAADGVREPASAMAALEHAYFQASAAGDFDIAAEAASALADLFVSELGRPADARRWDRVLGVAIERGSLDDLWQLRRSNVMAKILHAEGRFGLALERAESILGALDDRGKAEHVAALRESAHVAAGLSAQALDRRDVARRHFRAAEESAARREGEHAARTLSIRLDLASIELDGPSLDHGRVQELEQLVSDIERHVGRSALLGRARGNLAVALMRAGRDEAAVEELGAQVEVLAEVLGSDAPETALARVNLGVALSNAGRREAGLSHVEVALMDQEAVFGPDHLEVAKARISRGTILAAMGRLGDAVTAFELAQRVVNAKVGTASEMASELLIRRAHAVARRGDGRGAEALYREALVSVEPETILGMTARLGLVEIAVDRGDRGTKTRGELADLATELEQGSMPGYLSTWCSALRKRLAHANAQGSGVPQSPG